MPDLMVDFFNIDFYSAAIEHGIDKDISRAQLKKFCTQEFRLKLLDDLEAGRYSITPPRVEYIPKDDGTVREIYINTIKDRIILSAVNSIWYARHSDMISPACKAYMSGSSCAKTVKEVVKHNISGYKLDLSKYFDSVSHELINSYLAELDTHTPLDKAIYDYYNNDVVYIKGQCVSRFKSLAQGCAVSAFLSNCVLKDVDTQMIKMCEYYCRYSDDMLLLGKNADKALAELQQMLSAKGLKLNPNKIEKISSDKEFKFLGFGVCGKSIRISEKDFKSKKAEIKKVTKAIGNSKGLTQEEKLNKAVHFVLNVFINWAEPMHSWIYTKAQVVNDIDRLQELDLFCKEHIRAAVTGKWNYTTNMHKVTDVMLREAGYVSLLHMFKMAKMDRGLFLQECLQWRQHLK